MRHQVGLEGGDVEGAAGAVHHRAEQTPDLRAGAGLHQLVHGLGRAAQLTRPVTNNSRFIRVLIFSTRCSLLVLVITEVLPVRELVKLSGGILHKVVNGDTAGHGGLPLAEGLGQAER